MYSLTIHSSIAYIHRYTFMPPAVFLLPLFLLLPNPFSFIFFIVTSHFVYLKFSGCLLFAGLLCQRQQKCCLYTQENLQTKCSFVQLNFSDFFLLNIGYVMVVLFECCVVLDKPHILCSCRTSYVTLTRE